MGRPVGSKNKVDEAVDNSVETVENVPRGTIEEAPKQVRRYSSSEDHMGEGEPLCLNCGHRQDMHHVWDYFVDQVQMKDVFTGQHKLESVNRKEKVFNRERPCQHACLCKGYK